MVRLEMPEQKWSSRNKGWITLPGTQWKLWTEKSEKLTLKMHLARPKSRSEKWTMNSRIPGYAKNILRFHNEFRYSDILNLTLN